MKHKILSTLMLIVGLSVTGLAQGHQGHDSQNRPVVKDRQTNQAPTRQLSDLVKDGEDGLRNIKQAVRNQDADSLDRAMGPYISALSAIRDALRLSDPQSQSFEKDLARVEKMSRANLAALEELSQTAPVTLLGRLEDASAVTEKTLVAATGLQDEANTANGHHGGQSGQGCLGQGSRGVGCSAGRQSGGHHGGWLWLRRGC